MQTFQGIVKRALAHFENVSGTKALSNVAHLAGVTVDGLQRCVRCRAVLAVEGQRRYPVGSLVRRFEYPDGMAEVVEPEGTVEELCHATRRAA